MVYSALRKNVFPYRKEGAIHAPYAYLFRETLHLPSEKRLLLIGIAFQVS